jgi:hypothetical protein
VATGGIYYHPQNWSSKWGNGVTQEQLKMKLWNRGHQTQAIVIEEAYIWVIATACSINSVAAKQIILKCGNISYLSVTIGQESRCSLVMSSNSVSNKAEIKYCPGCSHHRAQLGKDSCISEAQQCGCWQSSIFHRSELRAALHSLPHGPLLRAAHPGGSPWQSNKAEKIQSVCA